MLSLEEYILSETSNGKTDTSIYDSNRERYYYNLLRNLCDYNAVLDIDGMLFTMTTITPCCDNWYIEIIPLTTLKTIVL